MGTWLERKQRVFELLDLPTTTSGDVASSVENALQEVMLKLAQRIKLEQLFVETSAQDLVGPAETLDLSSDFSITDLQEIYSVAVNRDPTNASSEYETWDEMSYLTHLNSISPRGDNRPSLHWAKSPAGVLHFTSSPETSETWSVKVRYYKHVAAYADGNSPELPVDHEDMLSYGAALKFPQYFSGDREKLLILYKTDFKNSVEALQEEMRPRAALKRRKARQSRRRSGSVNWGN